MGNSPSSGLPSTAGPSRRPLRRKRSAILSHFALGCVSSIESSESLVPSQETAKCVSNEKIPFVDHRDSSNIPTAYSPDHAQMDSEEEEGFMSFLQEYPEYRSTWILDNLRRTDFARLERAGETYVDYMGGALYPESLVRVHTNFLNYNILGNTHSVSNSSKLSLKCADEARQAVLTYFKASPSEYTVVFTANASAALKLVAESFPFTAGSNLVIGADSHNSVHGIREFAAHKGAQTFYIPSTPVGGLDISTTKNVLLRNHPQSNDLTPSLFVLTAQSNITNSKTPLSMTEYASSLGYCTLVDGAALAATSTVNLSDHSIDAMAVSFYKMFGYPTGVGALIVKIAFLAKLKRPWFAGGTVDVVQVPGNIVTLARQPHEQFEDGTINYLQLPAVTNGLRFLAAYSPFLPLRLSCLLTYLTSSLSSLRHDSSGRPVVQILSRVPTRRVRIVGEQAETGSLVSVLFLGPSGEVIPNSFIEHAASTKHISLRTGCMCNPGGAAAMLGIVEEMKQLYPGVTLSNFEERMGRELGVVRISLGLASNFHDVWRVIKFAECISRELSLQLLWRQWIESQKSEAVGNR